MSSNKENQVAGFDLEKMQAIAELGEVIRLQNEALERLAAFRKARPYMMMPNLAKMVEENLKENVTVLYKELNNLHKPAEQQTRYICKECKMAFVSALPGGICDECRARLAPGQPHDYVPHVATVGEDDEIIREETDATAEPDKISDTDEAADTGKATADNDATETTAPQSPKDQSAENSPGITDAYQSALKSDDPESAPFPDEPITDSKTEIDNDKSNTGAPTQKNDTKR